MAGTAVQEEREVGARDLPFEFMLNTLRLVEGFPCTASPNARACR